MCLATTEAIDMLSDLSATMHSREGTMAQAADDPQWSPPNSEPLPKAPLNPKRKTCLDNRSDARQARHFERRNVSELAGLSDEKTSYVHNTIYTFIH